MTLRPIAATLACMVSLLWGLFVGIVIGGGTSLLAVHGLHVPLNEPVSALWAYLFAAIGGVLVGLFAGKPIWAKGARIEAGLKAGFGALLGAGLMFALRKWVGFHVDLSSIGLGQGALGTNAALAFPMVATVIALLFEVDNMFGTDDKDTKGGKRIAAGTKARVATEEPAEVEAEDASDKASKAKR
ncbi:MAG: hypothetical protein HY898_04720 [Deltaproteobacteria bacterium]|nr:hypothetical protein [Deltaproteobacteria bacterium]